VPDAHKKLQQCVDKYNGKYAYTANTVS